MYLDYSKLEFDKAGMPEYPELLLETMSEEPIGVLSGVSGLHFSIKLSEPSQMSFDIASVLDSGEANPLYGRVEGYKLVYTASYGIYLLMKPETTTDGLKELKHVTGYSIEKELDGKKFFLAEGTYKFYNPVNPADTDTVVGLFLSSAPGWSVGTVSSTLYGKYRTFDEYNDYLLPFAYNGMKEKYHAVAVADSYRRTWSFYDADEEVSTLPIYLDFDNLLRSGTLTPMDDEMVTALRPHGSDGLDIRAVNPIGGGWLYDLGHFIANGDIPTSLGEKWNQWQRTVLNRRGQYRALRALEASAIAQTLSAQAALTDLQGELTGLEERRNIAIQQQSAETTAAGKAYQAQVVADLYCQIEGGTASTGTTYVGKKPDIRAKQAEINTLSANAETYTARAEAIATELSLSNSFTEEELSVLRRYFIEQDVTEETFVGTDIDTSVSGSNVSLTDETIRISGGTIVETALADFGKTLYTISGGTFILSGSHAARGDVIRGTMEVKNSTGEFVLSFYAGTITAGGTTSPSGTISVTGTISYLTADIAAVETDGVTERVGSVMVFETASGSLYLTTNVSDYQKYSVELELYDYAVELLSDLAYPTYEFSVDSGNFLFAKEFAPFRDALELGKGVYLRLNENEVITPYIIEFELDFEDRSKFFIVFSNRFKRYDNVATLKDMVEKSYSSSHTFDAAKHVYGQTAEQASTVSDFMKASLDAAVNRILAGGQTVTIDASGINIGADGTNRQIRITSDMMAFSDDNFRTAKMALGYFTWTDTDAKWPGGAKYGSYYGLNADVVAGRLLVGNELYIESESDTGVKGFKFDSTGAWLNNATFVLQQDGGGQLLLDPSTGLAGGLSGLYTTNGTSVVPTFKNGSELILDSDGMPKNANFFFDLKTGDAYLRGKVFADSGYFKGDVYANNFYFNDGNNVRTLINQATKSVDFSDLDYIDLGLIVLDGVNGKITFKEAPIQYQYSVNGTSGWHATETSSDKYRRESYDGGDTWGSAYQYRGTDGAPGQNGSDADVTWANVKTALQRAASTQTSFITADSAGAPNIYGGKIYGSTFYGNTFNIYPIDASDYSGAFNIFGGFNGTTDHFLRIRYDGNNIPTVFFESPKGAYANWDFPVTYIDGNISFYTGSQIDLSLATITNWGSNRPVAVFG